MRVLEESQWVELKAEHEALASPWMDAYRKRRSSRKPHPIYDFLFGYYNTKRRNFTTWKPMADMILRGEGSAAFLENRRYVKEGEGVRLDVENMDTRDRRLIAWVYNLISAAKARPSKFACFGLHEWAMVYKAEEVRHETTPLRPSQETISTLVESMPICCTHYDAFRFFTPEAVPLNQVQPQAEDMALNEQFGCIHFNMDLYRWSYKMNPWIGSELMMECFLLSVEARELDMRASPYDVASYGFEPICVETAEGRAEYKKLQEALSMKGRALADKVLEQCRHLMLRNGSMTVDGSVLAEKLAL